MMSRPDLIGPVRHPLHPRSIWLMIATPRDLTLIFAAIYLIGGGVGIYALTNPPSSIAGDIGPAVIASIGVLLILASLVGVPTSLRGVWVVERIALAFLALAILLYLGCVIYLEFTGSGNRTLQIEVVLISLAACYFRDRHIRDRVIAPIDEQVVGKGKLATPKNEVSGTTQ